jgi:four helix bundle protein
MAGARHFRELDCWQLATELKLLLYELAERPSVKRDFKFYDQLRDAAASAPRNIAEGFGRRTDDDFAHYLDIARGSLNECQNHLQDAIHRGYLNADDAQGINALAARTTGAVAGLQRWLRRKRAVQARKRRT